MEKELMELKQKEALIVTKAKEVQIVSQETLQNAVSITAEIKETKKRVEEIRKFFVDPLNAQIKSINAKFKPFTEMLDRIENDVKSKIMAYHMEQDAIRRAEEEKLRQKQQKEYEKQLKKAEKKGKDAPPPPPPVVVEAPPKVDGLQMRKVWDFEIVDIAKIPREFLVPDEIKIRKAIQSGAREIPGVKIFERMITAIKS